MAQIRLGGVYGVGKTTVLQEALRGLSEINLSVPLIKGSLIMARILGIHPDELPEQPEAKRHAARTQMYEEMARQPHGVRDGHFAVTTASGQYEFPRSPIDAHCVGALAVITADPEVIAKRRAGLGRPYRPTDVDQIVSHQAVEWCAAEALGVELGVPVHDIDNSAETTDAAVAAMQRVILSHCSE